ncbi:MAG: 7-cyano-7-deazaguanine synthase [Planctomycetota bacterium]|jgi:7-cyano-7-deazaguanine synthase
MIAPDHEAALVLLSGGLDSTVAAALHREAGGVLALALWVDYGQRAAVPERRAAEGIARAFDVPLLCTEQPFLGSITRTALVARDRPVPQPRAGTLETEAAAHADAVWVPNRNGLLVNLAAALAESRGIPLVVTGFNAEEARSFPDNGPAFLEACNAALGLSTRGAVRVHAPTIAMDKAELLRAGRRVSAPVDLAWSCYAAGPEPCGCCESCQRRSRAEALLDGPPGPLLG